MKTVDKPTVSEHAVFVGEQCKQMADRTQSLAGFFRSLPDISDIDVEFPRSRELPRDREDLGDFQD